jgi:ectoine hydroxylase-related dioxygenase (phytanoyl-CoA dioxygenase family)
MCFVPGSHRWGLQKASDFFAQDLESLKARVHIPPGQEWHEIAGILPPGGFTLHHDLTFHGSGPNLTTAPRRSFAIHLRTDKSRPVNDQRAGLTRYIDDTSVCPWIYP